MSAVDLSVIVCAHQDTLALNATLTSVRRAILRAEAEGWRIEALLLARDPGEAMSDWLDEHAPPGWTCMRLSSPSIGAARQAGIAASGGAHVSFIDAGDMWSKTWLCEALAACRDQAEPAVWRPELVFMVGPHYFDPAHYGTRVQPDTSDPGFDPSGLLASDPYSSSLLAPRCVWERVPFPLEDPARGWGQVDWWWTCNVAGAGFHHRVVPDSFQHRLIGKDGRPLAKAAEPEAVRIGPTELGHGMHKRLDLLVDIRETALGRGFHAMASLSLIADLLRGRPLHVLTTGSGDEMTALEAFSFDHGIEIVTHTVADAARLRIGLFFAVVEEARALEAESQLFRSVDRAVVGLLFPAPGGHPCEAPFVATHDTALLARRLAAGIAPGRDHQAFTVDPRPCAF